MTRRSFWWRDASVAMLIAGIGGTSFALAADPEEQLHRNPVPGVLATTSTSGAHTRAVQGEFGGEGLFTGENTPILGSLSKQGDSHWSVTLKNTTDDAFTLLLDLRQKDPSNRVLSSSSFSVDLKPKVAERRSFTRVTGASGAELSLRRFRNKTEEAEARSKRSQKR